MDPMDDLKKRELAMLREELMKGFKACPDVPSNLRNGLEYYVVRRIRTGDFLGAVLRNDLMEAIARAHPGLQMYNFKAIIDLLNNFVPAPCWGSEAKVEEWLKGRNADQTRKPAEGSGDSVDGEPESGDPAVGIRPDNSGEEES